MNVPQRLCRKCLLQDLPDEAELAESIRELIALLPDEQRADAETIRIRLNACRACDALHRGTCGLCGCYVELRTAKKWMHCPRVPARW